MRIYQLMSEKHGLKAIKQRRLKISRIHELNDPFEFLGVELSDRDFRRSLKHTKTDLSKSNGVLCFSAGWQNPVLWAHYADRHRGMCLGFDVPTELIGPVVYVNSRMPKPDKPNEPFVKKLLFTKFAHWRYEDEYRAYVSLNTPVGGLARTCKTC